MTFVEIKSKRCPCLFLSNNVKNDVNMARFYLSPASLVVSQTKQEETKILHLLKHESRRDVIMKIICSYQKKKKKTRTRKAAGWESSKTAKV